MRFNYEKSAVATRNQTVMVTLGDCLSCFGFAPASGSLTKIRGSGGSMYVTRTVYRFPDLIQAGVEFGMVMLDSQLPAVIVCREKGPWSIVCKSTAAMRRKFILGQKARPKHDPLLA